MNKLDTTPSARYHPLPVKLINAIARSLNSVGLARIELSEEALVTAARKQTGLDRFGDESFFPALRALLKALQEEAELNPFGRLHARQETVSSLKNRLWANACFEAHPEIRGRKTAAPIIIVGPVRSGTTRLHRMLAADTRLQHLTAWEGFNPAPRLDWPDFGKTARRTEVEKFLRLGRRLNPSAFSAHPMDAGAAEEEILLIHHSFCSLSLVGMYNIPSYSKWWFSYDKTAAYRYMLDLINLVSWSRGDSERTRWVLKTPQHMLDLKLLVNMFPDAKLIFTHRDPLKTVPSTMSLFWNFAVLNTDRPLRAAVRDQCLDLCETMARQCIKSREAIPVTQQLDVDYEGMNRDWRSVMRRIYDFIEIDFTPEAEQALSGWLTKSENENRHGGHRYSLDDFGITAPEVDARMMFYRERYAIPHEGR